MMRWSSFLLPGQPRDRGGSDIDPIKNPLNDNALFMAPISNSGRRSSALHLDVAYLEHRKSHLSVGAWKGSWRS